MATTYHAGKQKTVPQQQATLSFGFFNPTNVPEFKMVDPLVVATAAIHLASEHLLWGTFGNNLKCKVCGRCSLSMRRDSMETGYIECSKCYRKEYFKMLDACEYYWLMTPAKTAERHREELGKGIDEQITTEPTPPSRIELTMAPLPAIQQR